MKSSLDAKVVELLDPHDIGHPITYNHYLTTNIQQIQSDRRRCAIETTLKETFELPEITPGNSYVHVDFSRLMTNLVVRTEVDMERYASSLAVDYMEAYYQVSGDATPSRPAPLPDLMLKYLRCSHD